MQTDFKPVYIFGAGTSKMLGTPLLNHFLPDARQLMYSPKFKTILSEPIYDSLKKSFENVFEYLGKLFITRQYLGIDLLDLETLFSILDMNNETLSISSTKSLWSLRQDLFSLIIATLKAQTDQSNSNYSLIINNLAAHPNSSFITLNYDLAIENALKSDSTHNQINYLIDADTYSGKLYNDNSRIVLKLHGSANWVYCDECKKFTVCDTYITPLELDSNRHLLHDSNCKNQEQSHNIIVPPTWNKSNQNRIITRVWARAIEQLSEATHIFIIGYSFPKTDVFFDQLLTLSLLNNNKLKNVYIFNPDPEIKNTLNTLFDPHFRRRSVEFYEIKFEDLQNLTNRMYGAEVKIVSEKNLETLFFRLKHPR
jgi:NAD-dependent SIR2 family protein deacetylase